VAPPSGKCVSFPGLFYWPGTIPVLFPTPSERRLSLAPLCCQHSPVLANYRVSRCNSNSWLSTGVCICCTFVCGQVDSLEAADRRIDELADSGSLDPALLLTMAKAYAGARETDLTRTEVKDIMAHLYFKVTHEGHRA
jgi:hypothetical protein